MQGNVLVGIVWAVSQYVTDTDSGLITRETEPIKNQGLENEITFKGKVKLT